MGIGAAASIVVCLAYIVGLWLTDQIGTVPGTWLGIGSLATFLAGLGPRIWLGGPTRRVWIIAGLVMVLASGYYQWRLPVAVDDDVSAWLGHQDSRQGTVVRGQVEASPGQTRSGKTQFWLAARSVWGQDATGQLSHTGRAARGCLYVTIQDPAATEMYSGQVVTVAGRLYRPQPPLNPNGFNFEGYLTDHGCFAGLSASDIEFDATATKPLWRLWRLRERIITAQATALTEQTGALVSAMALGRRAVDLPYPLQDSFIRVGMAHTLAASGFHVSLVLGVVLALMKSRPRALQAGVGGATLVGYALLTGGQASVWRAVLMGGGALLGLISGRRVQSLGCLLVAATGLLLYKPIWIHDVGFQLSVLATLGLIVTARPLANWLDWLPSRIAGLLAVPLAAFLWTIPLQFHYFHVLSTYAIVLNAVATPLVTIISLGGIGSGFVAALWPGLGGAIASLLQLPAAGLIALVDWVNQLPASSIAVGHISLAQMLGLYGLLGLAQSRRRQQRLWLIGLLAVGLVALPLAYQRTIQLQATVLAAGDQPVLVLQNRQQTLLINGGSNSTSRYTVLPFLRQAGINRVDDAIALAPPEDYAEGWHLIADALHVDTLYGEHDWQEGSLQSIALPIGHQTVVGPLAVQRLGTDNTIVRFSLEDHAWLMVWDLAPQLQQHLAQAGSVLRSQVLWWDGTPLAEDLLEAIHPQVAIASSPRLTAAVHEQLQSRGIDVFCTGSDGAVLWTPRQGFWGYNQTSHHRSGMWE
ncbi:ComE operon protein 3 [Halomicronema hongdechloris C2206]|uniref:ComE operon protein 3 n=1 Tax=Halomicronema hongdechloris C2206 TaxID=1641165 RepID=A0A1V8NP37_9CYAN|nr:ComEC/Rec2 family competence protein [Halomicronema hongdechloris]ASC70221.1 ComE operon protein 3 [Halomicronema hongdechloris C2206]